MRTLVFTLSLFAMSSCSKSAVIMYDAGADFSVPRQSALVGKQGVTCCMVASGADYVMYLLDPVPGAVDSRGIQRPANGELHITNPLGADYVLGTGVPLFGYAFSPDGRFAMFQTKSKENYALSFATLVRPDFKQPNIINVVADGLQDYQLFQQGFFSASGRYFIVGVLPTKTKNSWDMHIVDMLTAKDVYKLDKGAFSYSELVAPDDTMVFTNSTSSTVAGIPSVQGLYVVNLSAAILAGTPPSLIDTRIGPTTLMADGAAVLYLKHDATLVYYDLAQKFHTTLATSVLSFSTGPERRGPIVWIGQDGSLHVMPLLGPEIFSLPAGSADPFTSIQFSPDSKRIYYFKRQSSQSKNGEMWSVNLLDKSHVLIGTRVSTVDLSFVRERMLTVQSVDGRGDFGDLTSSRIDGTDKLVIAQGAQLGGTRLGFPSPRPVPPEEPSFLPPDMTVPNVQPLVATLTNGFREPSNVPINEAVPLLGTLTLSTSTKTLGRPLGDRVPAGTFRFSADGLAIATVKDAKWDDAVNNYVGKLDIQPTLFDIAQVYQPLDGVSEVGTIVERQIFVNAPSNAKPGVYFIKY